jgi:hypothetical protein
MAKLVAKFTNADGAKLRVYANPGKKGFNVAASLKTPGQHAQTGCRRTCASDAEATAAFNALIQDAHKNGWSEVVKKDRNAFTSIPPAKGKKTAA